MKRCNDKAAIGLNIEQVIILASERQFYVGTISTEAGIIDDIVVATFDFKPENLTLMGEGKIRVTHVQRRYYVGYLVSCLLHASGALGVEETKALIADGERVDTRLDVVEADKTKNYICFLDSLGVP